MGRRVGQNQGLILPNAKTPTPKLVSQYLRKFERLERESVSDQSLTYLFSGLCPKNTEINLILLKVSALNDLYGTNIFDTYTVARHILEARIDPRLVAGDLSLVDDIANVLINGKRIKFYSFSTKYCRLHKPNIYPVFDYFVEKMIMHYESVDRFARFTGAQLRKYERFVEIIMSFREYYQLEQYSLREIDIFLWLAGKEWFPRKYR